MIPLKDNLCTRNHEISVKEARKMMEENGKKYLVVLDDMGRLVKLAFKRDEERVKVGSAIDTHDGWEERVKANISAGADLIVIDTSDAYNEFTAEVIRQYKNNGIKIPLCAGNVVTKQGAIYLMEAGADIIKVGMSSGSICTTKREKAVGRAPMSAIMDVASARKFFSEEKNKYIPIIMDGGIETAADMVVALSFADAVMMGGYFNKFFEAAAEKYDEHGKITTYENKMRVVATWGEGSKRARNMRRYGQTKTTFFAEGEEGRVPYGGRVKPTLDVDTQKIKAALSNAGCYNLKEFRDNVVLEIVSPTANQIITSTHNITSIDRK
jgi:IMP dehydrogenase